MQTTGSVVARAWLFHLSLAAWVLVVAFAVSGKLRWAALSALVALTLDATSRAWSRRSPVPMPHFMRWVLLLPRGPWVLRSFRRALEPRSGERMLEVGPGIGVHALPIAAELLPDGILDVLDVQQAMLDDLMRRAAASGLTNIVSTRGDAQRLPYPDHTFDATYLVSVLGEIPDPEAALREIRRVLKPAGRLVISEIFIDPDFVPVRNLRERAIAAGFVFERRVGPSAAYSAIFRRATADCAT